MRARPWTPGPNLGIQTGSRAAPEGGLVPELPAQFVNAAINASRGLVDPACRLEDRPIDRP